MFFVSCTAWYSHYKYHKFDAYGGNMNGGKQNGKTREKWSNLFCDLKSMKRKKDKHLSLPLPITYILCNHVCLNSHILLKANTINSNTYNLERNTRNKSFQYIKIFFCSDCTFFCAHCENLRRVDSYLLLLPLRKVQFSIQLNQLQFTRFSLQRMHKGLWKLFVAFCYFVPHSLEK